MGKGWSFGVFEFYDVMINDIISKYLKFTC